MADPQAAPSSQDFKTSARQQLSGLRRSILINAVLPVVIYLLVSPHMSTIAALALGAIPPLLYGGYGWVRTRSIDLISIISLSMAVVGMLLALLVQDSHILMLKDSFLAATFGLLCLLSLLSSKPIVEYMYWRLSGATPEHLARLQANWQVPYIRFVRRVITAIWGVVFLAETALDGFLVYHLPAAQWVIIHPFLFWGTMILAFGGAMVYRVHAQPQIATSLQQTAKAQEASTGGDGPEASQLSVGQTGSM